MEKRLGRIEELEAILESKALNKWQIARYKKMLDKENIRQWLIRKGFSGEGTPPELDDEIRIFLSEKYIELYKILTGKEFQPSVGDVSDRIAKNLESLNI